MRLSYSRHGKNYIFCWFESEHGPGKILLVSNPGTDSETVKPIRCRHAAGMSIKINKASLSAENAGGGVMDFLRWSINNDIATCYVNRILERFA